ncbi:MAG: cation:proton antiporter subunit C [Planctomycetota bacterium]
MLHYVVAVFLMMAGFYIVIAQGNLVKKVIGINMLQTSVFLLFITMAKVDGGTAPIVTEAGGPYSNPLPHALMLTAIVVGIATTAVGLALVVRIHDAYGTIEEEDLQDLDHPEDGYMEEEW